MSPLTQNFLTWISRPELAPIYLGWILFFILFQTFTETVPSIFNYQKIPDELPAELAPDVSPEGKQDATPKGVTNTSLNTTRAYHRAYLKLGLLGNFGGLVVQLSFLLLGGFGALDRWARALAGASIPEQMQAGSTERLSALLFIGALLFFKGLLDLPFSLYATFVLEERFGFNKTTWKTFVSDRIKGLVLGLLIGTPLLLGVLEFFERLGKAAWLPVWLGLTAVSLFFSWLAPRYLMPLFNRFTPLESGPLKEAIERFAQRNQFPLGEIFTMDGSRRSSKANAFFTGFGKNRRLVLFDTLIQKQTIEETIGVLAHEIGHFKLRHIPKMIFVSIASSGLSLFLLALLLKNPGLFGAFQIDTVSTYASLVLYGYLLTPLQEVLQLGSLSLSRKHEFEADRFAADTTGNPEALARALIRMSQDHLSHPNPHWLKVLLEYSHPPVLQRVRALRAVKEAKHTA